ncbi:hypothetical protein TNCT_331 [Trichonephila clavata]|uniref:Uncharacterized protein n=1 Tax=Trichonephila clavata TaxID=2740835 RepID=A0A8X6HPY1_TRICU|nr:hypothetical protein TNCT_331 [Trichonephila clavata]
MLTKVVFICVTLATVLAGKSTEISYEKAPFLASKFLGLPPTFEPKNVIAGHTTISQSSVIDHVAPTGLTGNAASTGISSIKYADIDLSSGILGAHIDGKTVISEPSTIGVSTVIDHIAPADMGTKTTSIAVSSPSYTNTGIPSVGLLAAPIFGKESIAAPSSSITDHVAPIGIPTSSIDASSLGYSDSGILSTRLSDSSIGKSILSTPAAVSYDSAMKHMEIPLGPAAASFMGLSSLDYAGKDFSTGLFGTLMGKTSFAAPSSISSDSIIDHVAPENIAASNPAKISSVNYVTPIAGKPLISDPAAVTTRTSVIKHIATPIDHAHNRYTHEGSGILSNGLFGTPVTSILGANEKNVFSSGLFSTSDSANKVLFPNGILSESFMYNNEKMKDGLTGTVIVGSKIATPTKYSTVIDHVAPTSIPTSPVAINGINENGFHSDSLGHGIFTSPLGMANGLFGIPYDGIFGNEAARLNLNTFLSKYHW